MLFLCLADDLTGALEVGGKLADAGLQTRVVTSSRIEPRLPLQALVVDTETRHVKPDEARDAVTTLALAAGGRECRILYKKTDSTLRGNIAPELEALLVAFPGLPLVYVPGYPEMRRFVIDGRLVVDGVPVSQSAFARDPLDPVTTDEVAAIFRTRMRPVLLDACEISRITAPAVHIVNTAAAHEVRAAAEAFCRAGLRLAAGPAGFAAALAGFICGEPPPACSKPVVRTCLVVNGSLNPVSVGQFQAAPCRRVRHPQDAVAALQHPGWVLLDRPVDRSGVAHAEQLGKAVADVLQRVAIEGVIVFGGDTAYAVLHELGEPSLTPLGEVLPGVPAACITQQGRDLVFVTKAGGFGSPDILSALASALARS